MKSFKNARTSSRLLDPPAASISSNNADDWESRPTCVGCNWPVPQTRLFKGRMLCLSCIAEFFDVDGEESDKT